MARFEPSLSERIPFLGQIVAFRNILIHGYAMVENELVWRVIQEDLPELRGVVKQLLEEASSPDGDS